MRAVIALVGAVAATTSVAAADASRLHGQNFFSNCYVSHISRDDPIVYPNQPGVSHSHTFFGSKSTNAASTARSLRASPTTCRRTADTAAYWVPTLYADGVAVKPTKGSAYFVLRARGAMRAFPPGLKIVAGDAHARSPQSRSHVLELQRERGDTVDSAARVHEPTKTSLVAVRANEQEVAPPAGRVLPGLLGRPAPRLAGSPQPHGLQP